MWRFIPTSLEIWGRLPTALYPIPPQSLGNSPATNTYSSHFLVGWRTESFFGDTQL